MATAVTPAGAGVAAEDTSNFGCAAGPSLAVSLRATSDRAAAFF